MADPAPDVQQPAPSFDVAGAHAAGASDGQIAAFLAPLQGFDLAGARAAGAPDDQIANFLAARPVAPPRPETSASGAFVRAAGEQALPATGGMAAAGMGAATGAALGAAIPIAGETGIPEAIGALGGGLFGFYAGAKAVESVQQAIIDKLPTSVQQAIGQAPEQRQADVTQHPYAAMAGGLAPNLLFLRPGAVEKAAENAPAIAKFMANPIAARVFGAGVNTALEAAQEGQQDQGYDPTKLAIAAGAGALMNRETALGRNVSGAGAAVAGRIGNLASPRPGVPRASTPDAAVADILQADNVDDSIAAAEDLAQRQTPIDVGQVAGGLDAGEPADQQQAKLLRLFDGLGSGVVEHDGSGGYQFRTTGPDGAEITHPVEVWDPNELRDETAPGAQPAIAPDTANAIRNHYAAAGIDTVFYRDDAGSLPFDGTFDPKQPDTIFVSNNPERAAAQVAGHEFTHVLANTTLPDGTSLGDLLNRQIAAGLTPEGQRYAEATFGVTQPQRAVFPAGPEGDAAHAGAVQAHLVNELGADIGAEAPKFQSFLPRVIDAVQQRFGNTVAGDVLSKLVSGLRTALDTVRGLFGDTGTESQNWVANIGDIHDTLARMYAERFGTPVEREQAALGAMRDQAARDALVAGPQTAQEGVSEAAPPEAAPGTPEAAQAHVALTTKALTLRRWATELSDEQTAAAAATPQATLLRQTEQAILRPVAGDPTALPPPQAARLEAVRSELDAATNPPDSPAVARVKDELAATVTAAKAARGPNPYTAIPRRNRAPVDAVRLLASKGGIRPDGDLRAMGADQVNVPFVGKLVRPGGMSLNTAREWLHGLGYPLEDPTDDRSVLGVIDEHISGRPTYAGGDQADQLEREAIQAHNAEIDRLAGEHGIDPAGKTYAEFFDEVSRRAEAPAENVAAEQDTAYGELERLAPDWAVDEGEPRSLEDTEREYRQAEDAGALGGAEEGGGGPEPAADRTGGGEAGVGPGIRGAGAGRGGEAEGGSGEAPPALEFSPRPPRNVGGQGDIFTGEQPEPQPRTEPEPTIRSDRRQVDMFGTSDAAVQAQAARDQAGRGGINPRGEVKAADEGLFARKEPKGGTLFSPRTPHERPGASAADVEEAPQLGRHEDDVSALIHAVVTERGGIAGTATAPTVEDRDLSRIAQLGSKAVKNLNPLERSQSIFPRTLAALDDKFASYYRSFIARQTEGDANAHDLRSVISDSLVKLPAESRDRVYAALELARKWNARPTNPELRARVRNNSYWQAQKSKIGDDYILTSEETQAFHDTLKLGDEGWQTFMAALVKREGWRGEADPDAIEAAAAKAGLKLPEGKRLMRLATALRAAEAQANQAYFPAMRFGDIFIAATHKVDPDLDNVSVRLGRPQVEWFQTVERAATRDLFGLRRVAPDQMQEVRDAIGALGTRTDNTGQPAFGEFKNTSPGVWESATHRIETGDLRRTPEALRQLNIPAIEKLFMLMERHATPKIIQDVLAERTPEEGLSPKDAAELKRQTARYGSNYKLTGGEAFERYQALLGSTKDTLLDALYHDLLAGWKKRAYLTPGYADDFDRAIGTHIGQVSRNAADMVHREPIDAAYQDIQDNHPNQSVRQYAQEFQRDQDNPRSMLSRAAQSANQVGFVYALAANPASTLKIMLHAPMMAAPVMSVGVGMGRAAKELALATGEAYRNVTFDAQHGASIDVAGLGKTPGEKAFIAGLDRAGLLHSVGADDVRGINDRQAGLWGGAAPFMRRAMDIAASNISVADQANRSAVALAAYRIAQNKSALMLAAKPLMRDNALFRADVAHATEENMRASVGTDQDMATAQAAALREVYPRFMLDQAAGQWGRANQAPAMRGTEGHLLFALHGFQTRYLSTMLSLLKNSGPEGKVAAAWMIGGLAAVAGVYGQPFVQDIESGVDAVWKAVTHVDPMIDAHLREWLADAGFGKVGSDVLLRGPASALFGVDTPSAVGFGDIVSRSMTPTDALGTVPSMLLGRLTAAYNRASTGQGAAVVGAELLPAALRNPAEAAIQAKQGMISARGEMEQPAGKIAAADTVKRAIGFTPLDAAQARARSEFDYDVANHDDELRQDVVRSVAVLAVRASAADRKGDPAAATALRAEASQIIQANQGLKITEQAYKDAEFEAMDPELYRLTRTPMRVRAQVQNSPYP